MTDVIKPFINIGGDTADVLMNNAIEASASIEAAIRAMQAATPHGRNFATPEDCRQARHHHIAQIHALQKMADQQMELARHANDFTKG